MSQPYNYLIGIKDSVVYAKNGQTSDIDYCGTDARTVIQSAIDALTKGGKIFIKSGTFHLSKDLIIPDSLSEKIILQGTGTELTRLKQTSAGKNVITVGFNTLFDIKDMSLYLPSTGSTGHGIESGQSGEYGWRYSRIESIEIWNGDSTHWGLKLVNPTFLGIRSLKIRNAVNGILLITDHTTLNFGHSWFSDVFVAPSNAVGILLKVNSVSKRMNQLTFSRLHLVPDSYVTGSKGIEITGDANWFFGVTAENLDYAVDVIEGSYNTFEGMYIRAKGETSAVLRTRSESRGTSFRDIDIVHLVANIGTALRDENTWKGAPTLFDHIRIHKFATYIAKTNATVLNKVSISETGASTENSGVATFSGDGTTKVFNISSHGLALTPTNRTKIKAYGTPQSTDAENASPLSVYPADLDGDGNYEGLKIVFAEAPIAGTDNVKVTWYAEL